MDGLAYLLFWAFVAALAAALAVSAYSVNLIFGPWWAAGAVAPSVIVAALAWWGAGGRRWG